MCEVTLQCYKQFDAMFAIFFLFYQVEQLNLVA